MTPPTKTRAHTATWWLAGLALSAIILLFFGNSVAALAHRWTHEQDYSHGFLVPVVALDASADALSTVAPGERIAAGEKLFAWAG